MPRPAVRSERLGPVARITLARPEVRNAQNTQLILFMVHQFMHGTKTAMDALAERRRLGSMRQLIAARDRGVAARRARCAVRSPASGCWTCARASGGPSPPR